jgi:hypothetical protein
MAAMAAETCWYEYTESNIAVIFFCWLFLYIVDLKNARKLEHIKTKFEVLTTTLIKIRVFWELTPCGLVSSQRRLEGY